MARAAGVGAFAFYYYAFAGRRVLERPLENLLASDVQMPFLLIWANENWSRTWTGSVSDVLLAQDYSEEHEDALLADFARHMADPRYVRLQGRPLFVVYNPDHVPDARAAFARWRAKWAAMGVEPLIFMAQTFGCHDPRPIGLDGALEFPPHKLGASTPCRSVDAFSADFAGTVYDYDAFAAASLREAPQPFPLIKTAVPMWDNDARRPGRGSYLVGVSPAKYEAWLGELLARAAAHPVGGTAHRRGERLERVGRGRLPGARPALWRRLPERHGPSREARAHRRRASPGAAVRATAHLHRRRQSGGGRRRAHAAGDRQRPASPGPSGHLSHRRPGRAPWTSEPPRPA
ncbi:glycoside hydrolase family 99-like domain-containing protein [Phenylobacterium sp. J426]|nr:glycoside hydrolase family 99-like domain-containing protein [Phenylobacterium sp. J426]